MKSGTRRNSERKKRNKIPEEFFTFYFFLSCAPLLLLFRVGLGFFIVFIDPRQTVYNDGTMTKRLLFRLLGNGPIFSLKLILFSNQMNRLEANNNNHVLFNLIDFILPFHWIFFFLQNMDSVRMVRRGFLAGRIRSKMCWMDAKWLDWKCLPFVFPLSVEILMICCSNYSFIIKSEFYLNVSLRKYYFVDF